MYLTRGFVGQANQRLQWRFKCLCLEFCALQLLCVARLTSLSLALWQSFLPARAAMTRMLGPHQTTSSSGEFRLKNTSWPSAQDCLVPEALARVTWDPSVQANVCPGCAGAGSFSATNCCRRAARGSRALEAAVVALHLQVCLGFPGAAVCSIAPLSGFSCGRLPSGTSSRGSVKLLGCCWQQTWGHRACYLPSTAPSEARVSKTCCRRQQILALLFIYMRLHWPCCDSCPSLGQITAGRSETAAALAGACVALSCRQVW